MTTLTVTVTETGGTVSVPDPGIDAIVAVVGYASLGSLGPSVLFGNDSAVVSGYGQGPAVDALAHSISRSGNPGLLSRTAGTTVGSHGTIDVTGVTGTCVVSNDTSVKPNGDYEAYLVVVNGGIVGVSGITLQWSLDNGRTLSSAVYLGTDAFYTIPNSGMKWLLNPSTTNAAYVALAVELQADTLAHLANVTAHDGADTSAAQIALNAASVPATVAASTAVVNLVLAALVAHVPNITSMHDGPDRVAYLALAALSAATDAKTGIDLANALKAILNAHDAVAPVAAPAGLLGSTASIAAPTTYTAADMLSGGIALMDAQPRRPTVTTGASGTPGDMGATAALSGFDYAGNAQNETLTLSQTAATATAAKAYRGTGFQMIVATADGTAATFTVGYSNGGHNSADATNVVTAADATYGTLVAGDIVRTKTTAPKWADADLYDGTTSPKSGAIATLARSAIDFGILYIAGPVASGDLATITAGLDYLKSVGKRDTCIVHARGPNVGESDADWLAAVSTDFAGGFDSRITVCAGTAWVVDPTTGRTYNRTFGPAFLGEVSRVPRYVYPGSPNAGALPGVALTDSTGNLIGHDDGPAGLSQFSSSDRFCALQRVPDPVRRLQVFTTPPYVLFQNTDGVKHLMARRVINAMEREAASISFGELGSTAFYDPATGILDEATMNSIAATIRQPLRRDFASDIQNPEDDGLVVVTPAVSVVNGFVTIGVKLYPKIFGYVVRIDLTFVIS